MTPITARLLLMGPPGAGKGTQAALLADSLGVPAISTGDIFRGHLRDGTSLGREAQRYMEQGEYVPDDVTNRMVRDRLNEPDATEGWLLDGYPRTIDQVAALDEMTRGPRRKVDQVIELRVDNEELVRRLAHRALAEGRSDDTEDVIRRRQEVYASETAPLLRVYAERNLLLSVDGEGPVEKVHAALRTVCGLDAEAGSVVATSN